MNEFPQDKEVNEYRYLSPAWINAVATGLTAGAEKHPGETWRSIPAEEHAWRAVRHLILWLAGDREDKHLDNASMRVMMAWETSKNENVAGVRVELASDIDVGRKRNLEDCSDYRRADDGKSEKKEDGSTNNNGNRQDA